MPNPSPIPPGLILVAHSDETPDIYLRALLENQVRTGGRDSGIAMPSRLPVVALHTGPQRAYKEAKKLATMYESDDKAEELDHKRISDRAGFDWSRDEGFQRMKKILDEDEEPACVTLMQRFEGALPAHTSEGLRRIHVAARSRKKHVLLIASFSKLLHAAPLRNLSNEFIEVRACQPDPGWLLAFSIECTGLRHLHPLGVGHVMAQIKALRNEQYSHQIERFICHDMVDRMMFYLRVEGHSLEKIGLVVGLNKSSVLRRLNQMQSHWQPKIEPNWRTAYTKIFDFSYLDDDDSDDQDED